ncbi:AbrB/MazE/SpoVT family DNA-binding domain-containing protein [Aerosakkonemataceae cyanobacterium BLCC-F50]|uniref:AbrB/MazE/SpoVT family DNA-binding domain-containing protein n=1 Tax=Floridaenema flaviceps BLCC-F50 TaxID=3153642 RepID=A0ABV4XNX8_9CYAN
METTKLSAEGKVLIPQSLREAHQWKSGQELMAIKIGDGILLKPKKPFPETSLHDVAGCLKYQGLPKTLEDMENAIAQGIEELWHDRS